MKLYIVEEMGYPYEPGYTHAYCTTVQRVRELFPKKIIGIELKGGWVNVHDNSPLPKEAQDTIKTWGRPSWYVNEVETDTQDYSK